MERLFLILIFVLSVKSYIISGEIKGVVLDTDSIPIEFVNVTAFSNDSVVGGAITDTKGLFTYVMTSQKLTDTGPFDTFGYLQLVGSTTFMLPKGFNLSMSCFYNSGMKIGNITVFPILNLNPTLQKQLGTHWSLSIGFENMLQRISKIRTESSGYDRLSYTKTYITAKIGVTYKFNSGKRFRAPRIEKNTDNSRFSRE